MKKIYCIILIPIVFLITSCASKTTDPRQGGLFGYDPEAYEVRLNERRNRLREAEMKQAEEKQKTKELQKEAELKRAELDDITQRTTALEKDLLQHEKLILSKKIETEERKQQYEEINKQLLAIKNEIAEVESKLSPEARAKKTEIDRLNRRIDELLQEAEILSSM